ncbi:GNAT family N-acetyltransferase [Peribacillus muralis]|uniref:GNAT family N-acetyltransferase n=1 Tax=Peribacillus muralis TaxID=264697 RepID=UPI003671CFB4
MHIKRTTLDELESLTGLFNSYRVFYEQASDPVSARGFLSERLVNGDSVVFMAFEEEAAVGFVQLYPSFSSVSLRRSWILNDLYVLESVRKKGFGEALLKAAITFAKETGARGVSLETGKENVQAQRLYEKIGFARESNYFYHFSTI